LSPPLSPMELRLTRQIDQMLQHQSTRIRDLEARLAVLEQEREAMLSMLGFFDTLSTPRASSTP